MRPKSLIKGRGGGGDEKGRAGGGLKELDTRSCSFIKVLRYTMIAPSQKYV